MALLQDPSPELKLTVVSAYRTNAVSALLTSPYWSLLPPALSWLSHSEPLCHSFSLPVCLTL